MFTGTVPQWAIKEMCWHSISTLPSSPSFRDNVSLNHSKTSLDDYIAVSEGSGEGYLGEPAILIPLRLKAKVCMGPIAAPVIPRPEPPDAMHVSQ